MVRTKALIASKASHGRDALLRQIVVIEHECELDEFSAQFDDRPRVRRPRAVEQSGDMSSEHDAASHAERAIA
jgi:hypothetical protein